MGEVSDDVYGLDAEADDLADEADDVFGVVGVVGVGADAAALVLLDAVLVDDAFEAAAVAEAVVEDLGRDAGQRERVVDDERLLVLGELHLLDHVAERLVGRLDPLQRPRLERFVGDVQVGEAAAGVGNDPDARCVRRRVQGLVGSGCGV